ncbi:MAG: protein phosphatase 2C domain-containing protein [Defluviitaleaceae bacterium]|nr:protein phosphatase 2C domain-containing protein [Defluviitaleaceae bacterium]MCL2264166.1 protein phosphatase 2C domain-containing protein [Defluviitaleaceae bacterium]
MIYGEWQAVGGIVIGATHIRQDKPCQDALLVCALEEEEQSEHGFETNDKGSADVIRTKSPLWGVSASIGDGHGSDSCPYSNEGAEAAVKIACEIFREMHKDLAAHKDIRLPKLIEAKWKERIREIHEENGREYSEPFPYILYGTTLLAVVASEDFIFALQIGDGNILLIDKDANAHPILAAEENVGEDTESLCLTDAWTYIRTQIIPWNSSNGPAMVLLSTDGYANSFSSASGFLKAGADFFKLWQEEGLSYVDENLSDWLRQSSDKGSGDDIAMALLVFE